MLRLFNILVGAVALVSVYGAVRLLLPDSDWAPLGATAFVALNPAFVFMTSTIHHDTFLTAIYCAGLFWAVRTQQRPLRFAELCIAGALCGAALLTKLSGATLPLVLGLAVLLRPVRPGDWANRWLQFVVLAVMATAVAGWWLIRNQILYGDLTAWTMFERVHAHMLRPSPLTWDLFVNDFGRQLMRTFWGAFGYMHILLPAWTRDVLWAGTLIALVGVGVASVRFTFRKQYARREIVLGILLLFVAFALHFGAFVEFASRTIGAGHGRYLFPVVTGFVLVLIAGFNGYTNWRHQRIITLSIVALLTVYAIVVPYRSVWPKYQIPDSPPAEELAAANAGEIMFEQGITLLALAVSDAIVIPGQALDVTTYWSAQVEAPQKADAFVILTLVSDDGTILGQSTFWPEVSTTPAVWQDRIVVNRQSFYIPPDHASGLLRIQIEVRNGQHGPGLVAIESGETVVTVLDLLALGAVIEVDASDVPEPERGDVFADNLQLAAVVFPDSTPPSVALPVQLYWRVLAPVAADYTIFIHILDANDQIVAQLDRPPGGGASPTTTWQQGHTLLDTYPVALPETLVAGEYRIRLGLYTWPDLSLQSVTTNGMPVGDSIIVGKFVVVSE